MYNLSPVNKSRFFNKLDTLELIAELSQFSCLIGMSKLLCFERIEMTGELSAQLFHRSSNTKCSFLNMIETLGQKIEVIRLQIFFRYFSYCFC